MTMAPLLPTHVGLNTASLVLPPEPVSRLINSQLLEHGVELILPVNVSVDCIKFNFIIIIILYVTSH